MKIPLVDLKAQYLSIKEEIDAAIQRVIDETSFIMGEEVQAFESEFAKFCGARFAIGVSSGTDALHLALKACGVSNEDEVITVPNTFVATSEAITQAGARPIFVDIDPQTCNMDTAKIKPEISPNTKAIVPVHLYGQPADMDPILEIAEQYNLKVIEDAAQAHGAEYKGRKVGTIGEVGCFSFFPGKNLGAYGDAGMVTTNNEEIAHKIRLLRNHGREAKYEHLIEGYCDRLDTLQAAILRVKLKKLPVWTEKRRVLARLYNSLLKDLDVVTPFEPETVKSVCHLYVVRTKNRDKLQQALKSEGISTGIHYPLPLHLQPAYNYLGYQKGDFRVTEEYAGEILSLPLYPELKEEEIRAVVEVISRC